MHLEHSIQNEKTLIVSVDGILDMWNFRDLELFALKNARDPIKFVVLDLKKCDSVDSSGMGCIIRLSTNLKEKNKKFLLINLPNNIRTIFRISQIEKYFTIASTESLEDYLVE